MSQFFRFSLAAFIALSLCLVILCEEESCSKDGEDCAENDKSVMLERDNKMEVLEDDEGIVEEKTDKSTKTDEIEEVDGMFEPCTKTEKGGQLYKMMILNAGYKLTEGSKMIRVHCQADSDDFFANGYYQTTGYVDGEEVVIVAIMPSQGIQPHAHDLTEDITLGHGELKYFTWLEGPGIPSNRTVQAGSPVGVVSGVTHAVFAGPEGAVYHEPANNENASRKTWFAPN